MSTALGAGPHIRKRIPSKRIKALHRNALEGGARVCLRVFARVIAESAASDVQSIAVSWFANKGVSL